MQAKDEEEEEKEKETKDGTEDKETADASSSPEVRSCGSCLIDRWAVKRTVRDALDAADAAYICILCEVMKATEHPRTRVRPLSPPSFVQYSHCRRGILDILYFCF